MMTALVYVFALSIFAIFFLMARIVILENEKLALNKRLEIVHRELNYIFDKYGKPE